MRVFSIVSHTQGVLSATPLVFIIPTACYLRLSKERWNHSDNLISCLILAVGVLVMTVGFVLTILHPQECSHGKEMFYCFPSNVSFHNSTLPPQVACQSPDQIRYVSQRAIPASLKESGTKSFYVLVCTKNFKLCNCIYILGFILPSFSRQDLSFSC